MSARSRGLAGIVAAFTVMACTLTRTSVDTCRTNADCRDAFGAGRVCSAGGLCELAPPSPRCATTFPADLFSRPESYPGAIVIGALMDRSVETQRARENAIRLAATQANEDKGLDGRLFGVVLCDVAENTQYDSLKRTEAAVANARYLADVLGVHSLVGPSSSTDALAVFDAVKGLDVLTISPSATSPALTGADVKTATDDQPGLLWRTAPPDTLQGAAIVRYLSSTGVASPVAIIQEKGPYGDALAAALVDGLKSQVVKSLTFSNTSERDAAIVQAGGVNAKVAVFVSSQTPDAIAFLNAAKNLATYDSMQLFLTDSAANNDLLTGAAAASSVFPRVTGSRPSVPQGPTYELFKTSYSAAFRQDPNLLSFVPHAYDATWLAFYGTAYALRREGKITGHGVARGLRRISDPGRPEVPVAPSSFKDIVGSLGSGQTVNLVGASGSLDYDPTTEETTGLVDIWTIKPDGKSIATLKTIDPR